MKSFFVKSTFLTIIVFILGAIAYTTFINQFFLPVFPAIVVFYYIVTNLVHSFLVKMASNPGSKFTSQYMAISFIKMFFYLAVAIVYVLIYREDTKIFLVNFLLLYVIYTTFEVVEISKVVRQINK